MADAAKHAALLIALGAKPKGDTGDDSKPEGGGSDSMESTAVDDMFDAIASKDKAAFGEALKRYVQLCTSKDGDEEEEPASKGY